MTFKVDCLSVHDQIQNGTPDIIQRQTPDDTLIGTPDNIQSGYVMLYPWRPVCMS